MVLFHRHTCEAVDDDSLLELADWAVRKLAYLNSGAHKHAAAKGEIPHAIHSYLLALPVWAPCGFWSLTRLAAAAGPVLV